MKAYAVSVWVAFRTWMLSVLSDTTMTSRDMASLLAVLGKTAWLLYACRELSGQANLIPL